MSKKEVKVNSVSCIKGEDIELKVTDYSTLEQKTKYNHSNSRKGIVSQRNRAKSDLEKYLENVPLDSSLLAFQGSYQTQQYTSSLEQLYNDILEENKALLPFSIDNLINGNFYDELKDDCLIRADEQTRHLLRQNCYYSEEGCTSSSLTPHYNTGDVGTFDKLSDAWLPDQAQLIPDKTKTARRNTRRRLRSCPNLKKEFRRDFMLKRVNTFINSQPFDFSFHNPNRKFPISRQETLKDQEISLLTTPFGLLSVVKKSAESLTKSFHFGQNSRRLVRYTANAVKELELNDKEENRQKFYFIEKPVSAVKERNSNVDPCVSERKIENFNQSFDRENSKGNLSAEGRNVQQKIAFNGKEVLRITKQEQSGLLIKSSESCLLKGNMENQRATSSKKFSDPTLNSVEKRTFDEDSDFKDGSCDEKWVVHFADSVDDSSDDELSTELSISIVPALNSDTDNHSTLVSNDNQIEDKATYQVDSNEEKTNIIDLSEEPNPIIYFNNGAQCLKIENEKTDGDLFVSHYRTQKPQTQDPSDQNNNNMAQKSNVVVSLQGSEAFEPVLKRAPVKTKHFISPGDQIKFKINVNASEGQKGLSSATDQGDEQQKSSQVKDLKTPVNPKRNTHGLSNSGKSGVKRDGHPQSVNKQFAVVAEHKSADEETDINIDENLKEEIDELINYKPQKLAIPSVDQSHANQFEFKTESNDSLSDRLLKMENARLHQLLMEVEQARSGTAKALVQVNSLLSNVQGQNVKLAGDLRLATKEKLFAEESLKEVRIRASKSEEDLFTLQQGVLCPEKTSAFKQAKPPEFETSLKVIIDSWKKEKRDLLQALSRSTARAQHAESDVDRLKVQFKKVKEQLENSNSTFTRILEHNMKAARRVENEMENMAKDKKELTERLEQMKDTDKLVDKLKLEIEELKQLLAETNMEKGVLVKRIQDLTKKNKDLQAECSELRDMEEHSQDILEKLTENEERLREQIKKEISEKNYLQDCLDETGQILLHLRNAEQRLTEEKGNLEEDLEVEIQEKECLQHSLKRTLQDHKDLVSRLESMTNVHVTVKESLQQATQKEKNYQQQIAALTKTNHILHYTLEKTKEEKDDLREMYDSLEHEWKQFKMKVTKEQCEMKSNIDHLSEENASMKIENENLKKENVDFRTNLEQEEEDNDTLRKSQSRLEKHKNMIEDELARLREQRDELDKEVSDLRKRNDDFKIVVKSTNEKNNNLTCTLEETEESLEKISKDLKISNEKLKQRENEVEEMSTRVKEKQRKLREVELDLEQMTADKERFQNRVEKVETELKELRRTTQEQKEEIGMFEFQVGRFKREKEKFRREGEEHRLAFEKHKQTCGETLQTLKEEIVGLKNQLIEKDRLAMKQKETFQDAIDNSNADLSMLRQFFNDQIHKESNANYPDNRPRLSSILATTESEKIDIEFLRNVHSRSQEDMLKHLSTLEGILRVHKENKDMVTVVQSPMSKIKLEEIRQLRDEMYELKTEIGTLRTELANTYKELMITKLSVGLDSDQDISLRFDVKAIEQQLNQLNEAIADAELEQKAIIKRSSSLIRKGAREVNGDHTGDDACSGKPDNRNGELITMQRENHKLKTLVETLKRQYNFDEKDFFLDEAEENDSSISPDSSRPSSPAYSTASVCSSNTNQIDLGIKLSDNPPSGPSERYCPPTSMRYPPRVQRANTMPHLRTSGIPVGKPGGNSSDYHYSSGSDRKKSITKNENGGERDYSLFSAEMSMFEYDSSRGSEILRRKLQQKALGTYDNSDSGSVRGRSGSIDDDSDYDPPPDEFKRTRTVPKGFKPKALFRY